MMQVSDTDSYLSITQYDEIAGVWKTTTYPKQIRVERICWQCGLILEGSDSCPRCIEAQTPNEKIWFAGKPSYAIMTDSENQGRCVVCGGLTTWEYHYKSVHEDCQHEFDARRRG